MLSTMFWYCFCLLFIWAGQIDSANVRATTAVKINGDQSITCSYSLSSEETLRNLELWDGSDRLIAYMVQDDDRPHFGDHLPETFRKRVLLSGSGKYMDIRFRTTCDDSERYICRLTTKKGVSGETSKIEQNVNISLGDCGINPTTALIGGLTGLFLVLIVVALVVAVLFRRFRRKLDKAMKAGSPNQETNLDSSPVSAERRDRDHHEMQPRKADFQNERSRTKDAQRNKQHASKPEDVNETNIDVYDKIQDHAKHISDDYLTPLPNRGLPAVPGESQGMPGHDHAGQIPADYLTPLSSRGMSSVPGGLSGMPSTANSNKKTDYERLGDRNTESSPYTGLHQPPPGQSAHTAITAEDYERLKKGQLTHDYAALRKPGTDYQNLAQTGMNVDQSASFAQYERLQKLKAENTYKKLQKRRDATGSSENPGYVNT